MGPAPKPAPGTGGRVKIPKQHRGFWGLNASLGVALQGRKQGTCKGARTGHTTTVSLNTSISVSRPWSDRSTQTPRASGPLQCPHDSILGSFPPRFPPHTLHPSASALAQLGNGFLFASLSFSVCFLVGIWGIPAPLFWLQFPPFPSEQCCCSPHTSQLLLP